MIEWRVDLVSLLFAVLSPFAVAVGWLTKVEFNMRAFQKSQEVLQANIDEVHVVAAHADNKVKDLELGVERDFVRSTRMTEFQIHFDKRLDRIDSRFDKIEALLHDRRREP